MATASVAAFGLIAVVGLAFARETRGEAMPADPEVVAGVSPAEEQR